MYQKLTQNTCQEDSQLLGNRGWLRIKFLSHRFFYFCFKSPSFMPRMAHELADGKKIKPSKDLQEIVKRARNHDGRRLIPCLSFLGAGLTLLKHTKTMLEIIKCKHQLLLPLIHFNKASQPPVPWSNSSQLKFKGNRFSLFSVLGMFCSFPGILSITGWGFTGEENYRFLKAFSSLSQKPNKEPHLWECLRFAALGELTETGFLGSFLRPQASPRKCRWLLLNLDTNQAKALRGFNHGANVWWHQFTEVALPATAMHCPKTGMAANVTQLQVSYNFVQHVSAPNFDAHPLEALKKIPID